MTLTPVSPGIWKLDGQNWRLVETVFHEGKVYLNLIRRGKIKTVRFR